MISRKEFNDYIVKQTNKYQKKYNFEIGTGEHASWNNEADAFKHAYLEAWLTIRHGNTIAKVVGNLHENETLKAPINETNMDKWNNAIGREIGREIKEKMRDNNYSQNEIEDMIAEKVMQKMKNGELITDPKTDNRIYKEQIFKDRIFDIKNRIFHKGELSMKDMENSEIMDTFLEQMDENKELPKKEELDMRVASGELVYVSDYKRSDGTKVSGYYRKYPKG